LLNSRIVTNLKVSVVPSLFIFHNLTPTMFGMDLKCQLMAVSIW